MSLITRAITRSMLAKSLMTLRGVQKKFSDNARGCLFRNHSHDTSTHYARGSRVITRVFELSCKHNDSIIMSDDRVIVVRSMLLIA